MRTLESEWELPECCSHTITYRSAAHTSVCRLSCTIHIVTDIICSLVSTGSDELSYQLTRVLPVIMTWKIGQQVNNIHKMEFPEILSQKFTLLVKYAKEFENKTLCATLKIYINTLYIQMKQLEKANCKTSWYNTEFHIQAYASVNERAVVYWKCLVQKPHANACHTSLAVLAARRVPCQLTGRVFQTFRDHIIKILAHLLQES